MRWFHIQTAYLSGELGLKSINRGGAMPQSLHICIFGFYSVTEINKWFPLINTEWDQTQRVLPGGRSS